MRKLKQATQRQKARRVLKQKKRQTETTYHDGLATKSMAASLRNEPSPPGRASSNSQGRGQKVTLH